jgi:integrase
MSDPSVERSTGVAVPVEPLFSEQERPTLVGFLSGYSGQTRVSYTLDLRQYTSWCAAHGPHVFAAKRAHIECYARDLEKRGRARATIARRLCTISGFYRYAVEEDLLEHSPAVHVRRPRLDYESHATALDRNEIGALLVAAGLGTAAEHALIALLVLNGLRIGEALGADIDALGIERGHRTLTVLREDGKIVTIPSRHALPAPSTSPSANGSRGRSSCAPTGSGLTGTPPPASCTALRGTPVSGTTDHPTHTAARIHHRRPGRRRRTARRARSRQPRRPAHHHALRPIKSLPGPARHLHRGRLPGRRSPLNRSGRSAPHDQRGVDRPHGLEHQQEDRHLTDQPDHAMPPPRPNHATRG